MSPEDRVRWEELLAFWGKHSNSFAFPPRVANVRDAALKAARKPASSVRDFAWDHTPESVIEGAEHVADVTWEPFVRTVEGLLLWVAETVREFSRTEPIFEFHRSRGRSVFQLDDLAELKCKELDEFTRHFTWRFRTIGLVEGAAFGLLAFIPVAGSITSIGADLLVMHALSVAPATRTAHSYGIDLSTEEGGQHLENMIRGVWKAQLPKAAGVKAARDAFRDGAGRVRWSDKFRHEHRIAAAMEQLLKTVGHTQSASISTVVKSMPVLGLVTSAGFNSATLGTFANNCLRYAQTVHLARKYDLPLPFDLAGTGHGSGGGRNG